MPDGAYRLPGKCRFSRDTELPDFPALGTLKLLCNISRYIYSKTAHSVLQARDFLLAKSDLRRMRCCPTVQPPHLG
jgi:hypothetical protein